MTQSEKEKILQDVLKRTNTSTSDLPNLDETENMLTKLLGEIWESIRDWFKSMFSSQSNKLSQSNLELFKSTLLALVYLTIAFLILYLGYQLYKLLITKNHKEYASRNSIGGLDNDIASQQDPNQLLVLLLESKRYKEALRLRWLIFLTNMNWNISLTPSHIKKSYGQNLEYLNKPMFSLYNPNHEEIDQYFSALQDIENLERQR
jgi:hypothetical protein